MRFLLARGIPAGLTALVCASVAAQVPAPAAAPAPQARERAEAILAEARKALGADKLASVRTVVASGRTRRVRGNNLVPVEFELFVELPDKYVRVDEFPAEDAAPTSSGFAGDALIQVPAAPDPRRARVTSIKQDFARLALGLFAASPSLPLTFTFAAIAEAPQGKADVLDAKGEGNFALRYFIHHETRLPIMVTWNTPPTSVVVTVPGAPPPSISPGAVVVEGPPAPAADAPKEEKDRYAKDVLALRQTAQATPVEHRLYFADYREVDGVRFPFRLRRAIGTETTEETTFDRFRINTRIDPRKFTPVK